MTGVTLVHDASSDPDFNREVARLHDPVSGTVVVRGSPGTRRDAWAYSELLRALGKTYRDSDGDRALIDSEVYATAWLAAEGVRRLVLLDANLFGKHVQALCLTATGLAIDTVVVTDGPMSDFFRAHLTGVCDQAPTEGVTPDAYRATLVAAQSEHKKDRPSAGPAAAASLPSPPSSTVLTFRADMRRAYARQDFKVADELYLRVFTTAMASDLADRDAAGRILHRLMCESADPARQTIALRAVQAAAFHQHVHLAAKADDCIDGVAPAATARNMPTDDWRRVCGAVRAYYPAVVALFAAGIPTDAIHAIAATAVADDGSTVDFAGEPFTVPFGGRAALRAQLVVQRWFGHEPHEPLLWARGRVERRDTGDALNLMGRVHSLNLRLRSRDLGKESNWWQSKRGVTVAGMGRP